MLDIEKMLREGKSLSEIGDAVSKELNTAQTKIDAEKEAARIAAEKKAKAAEEAKKASKRKADARAMAVAALTDYFTLVLPHGKEMDMKKIADEALDSLEEGIKVMSNVTVQVNGNKPMSLFDLLDL